MRNISLDALHIFRTVAEEGGINRAAAKLHRVQSNVTTRVKQLEEQLGTTLFLRRGRGLALSAEGKLLLGYADQLLRISSEAESALRKGVPRGTLRIGTLESTAAARLPPVLSQYHRACPEVRIELATGTSGALIAKLASYEIEAAFVAEPFATPEGIDSQHVFTEELVLITPSGSSKVRAPKDIAGSTVIAFAAGCSYRRRLEDWLGKGRVVPDRVMEFASYHAIVACVAAGSGVAVVPRSIIRAVLGAGQVDVHPLPAAVARARTQLVWRRGQASGALEALRRQLAARPPKG
jgi:DNA-binding transcriptional LysR family regulator